MDEKKYKNFKEFYPYYLNEHKRKGTRICHFIGTSFFLILFCLYLINSRVVFLFSGMIAAYAFAWMGHFFIEKNKPATFKYPFMSLFADFKLYFEILIGKQKFKG